ncbi:MAG: protein-glutamate O-methyltransferase [Desulfobulbaceae bacterium]|nr:protein-glutamate O-methyltransferase [Desulfobulbaceae bacterium]HIJ91310.1 protein-glutamate O-methyltransferase [Deltaproteobacteria bacterium]
MTNSANQGTAAEWSAQARTLSDRDFNRFSAFIYEACGIKLSPIKKTMLSARLQKRLRQLQLDSFSAYLDYVLSPDGQAKELCHMIDVVSTNKTDFFREEKHFEVMTNLVLPDYVQRMTHSNHKTLRVWSAGCSSGEEPYTLAMVLDDYFSRYPGLDYAILATDICTEVLAKAEEAIYSNEVVAPVAPLLRNKYLMKGKGAYKGFHRVVPELRRKVVFRRLNFMDRDFGIDQKMDLIFCRNVIIYFDRKTQCALFEKFYRQFSPKGYLFTGHSETLEGIGDRMERVAAAVYRCR